MNRGSFFLHGVIACSAILCAASGAQGARLPVSTVTVHVVSVDRQSFTRETYANGMSVETTKFVAKAQIEKIVVNDHHLSPGSVIEILFEQRQPPLWGGRDRQVLKVGETMTLSVFGGGRTFTWRR